MKNLLFILSMFALSSCALEKVDKEQYNYELAVGDSSLLKVKISEADVEEGRKVIAEAKVKKAEEERQRLLRVPSHENLKRIIKDFDFDYVHAISSRDDAISFYVISKEGNGFFIYKNIEHFLNRVEVECETEREWNDWVYFINDITKNEYVSDYLKENYGKHEEWRSTRNLAFSMFENLKSERTYISTADVARYSAEAWGALGLLFGM
jgi:hypothetical protein